MEEEHRRVLAEQLDRRIKEDLERRDRQIRENQKRRATSADAKDGSNSGIGPDGLVVFEPNLQCIHAVKVSPLEGSSSAYGIFWKSAQIVQSSEGSGGDICLLKTTFTSSAFYGSSQGRKRLQQLEHSVNQAAQVITEHPNIQRILGSRLDTGAVSEQTLWTLIEHRPGLMVPLAQLLRQSGTISVAKAMEYFQQLALAVSHIHRVGLLHRDICVGNIYIDLGGGSLLLGNAVLGRALKGKCAFNFECYEVRFTSVSSDQQGFLL